MLLEDNKMGGTVEGKGAQGTSVGETDSGELSGGDI